MPTCIHKDCPLDAEADGLYCRFHRPDVGGKLLAHFVWGNVTLGPLPAMDTLKGELLGEPGEYEIQFVTSDDEPLAEPLRVVIGEDGARTVEVELQQSVKERIGERGTVHLFARIRPEAGNAWTKGAGVDVDLGSG